MVDRAKDELTNVKNRINELKSKLDSLKLIVDGQLSTDLNSRKTSAKGDALATVAASGAPHFQDNWGSFMSVSAIDPRYRFTHCGQAHCYGPGPNVRD